MSDCFATFAASFRAATVSVDGSSGLLLFDDADARALKMCIDRLDAEPECRRLDFYRDLMSHRPLRGPDGILMQLVKFN